MRKGLTNRKATELMTEFVLLFGSEILDEWAFYRDTDRGYPLPAVPHVAEIDRWLAATAQLYFPSSRKGTQAKKSRMMRRLCDAHQRERNR